MLFIGVGIELLKYCRDVVGVRFGSGKISEGYLNSLTEHGLVIECRPFSDFFRLFSLLTLLFPLTFLFTIFLKNSIIIRRIFKTLENICRPFVRVTYGKSHEAC